MFGGGSSQQNYNPALVADTPKPANTPTKADSTVLLAGLMGMRPRNNPALSTNFATGSGGGLGRRPALQKRVQMGGA